VVLGKLNVHMQKTKTRSLPLTLYKSQFKVDQNLYISPKILKLLQKKKKTLEDVDIGNDFLTRTPMAQKIRARIDKWDGLKQTQKLLHSKGNNYKSKETAFRMKEDLC
jgi:hypothetical protein